MTDHNEDSAYNQIAHLRAEVQRLQKENEQLTKYYAHSAQFLDAQEWDYVASVCGFVPEQLKIKLETQ